MSKYQTPYRYDFVGSFLRSQEVKQAKADYSEGKITKEECDAIVDKAVTEVVAKQKELGFHIITDGEFRRTYWHLDFMWGFEGVGHEQTGAGVQFNAEMAAVEDTYLTGKVKAKAHPFVEGFKFLKQFEDENTVAKYTIPAPAQMFQQMIVPANFENTRKYYATNEELIQDIGKAYQEVIRQFYEAGCSNLQLDDCTWGAIVGDAAKQRYERLGLDLNKVKAQLLEVNNLALEGKPEDMVITSHICRGNYHSTFFTSGPYDSVADYVFAKENVDALFLEYDDARSGGFAPLAKVSEDKKVVLGLITTKSPELEDKETVIKRIYEAAKYIPLERLCLSPQCGFASCEIGNKLTEEEQWAKLKLVKEIANRDVPVVCDPTLLFTGDEWMAIQQKEPIVKGKYILCYFLGNNPPHREFAKRLKEVTGCKIIALTHLDEFVKSDEGYADETPYDIDPADFLNLIRNAEYVCTDSFHCSVFSILYKRQFFTFRRYNRNTKQSTNSRLDTLFHMAGISGRLLTGEENIADCLKIETDFESVHKKLEGIRQKSYEYLLAALKDEGSTDL